MEILTKDETIELIKNFYDPPLMGRSDIAKELRPTTKNKILNAFPDFSLFLAGKNEYFNLAKEAADNFDLLMKDSYFKSKVESYGQKMIIDRLQK